MRKSFTLVKEKSQDSNHFLTAINFLPILIVTITFFLVPLFPDEKLNRLKLIVFGIGLILAMLFWSFTILFKKRWIFYRTSLDPYLIVYFISAIFYYQFSENRAVASSEFQRMIFSIGSFFIAVQVCSEKDSTQLRKIVLTGWVTGLFLVSIYGILQKVGGWGRLVVPQMERVFGTFGNPIFFAAFLIVSIPIVLGWLIQSKSFWFRSLLSFVLVLSLLALFCTGTRASFLSLPLSLLFFYLLLDFRHKWRWAKTFWRWKWVFATILLFLTVSHIFLNHTNLSYQNSAEKIKGLIHSSRMTEFQQTHTLIWKDVFKMWRAHKWVGTGYGTFHIEFPQYASDELKKIFPQQERIVNDAHNEYLQIIAETGLIGFLIFISLIAVFYLATIRSFGSLSMGTAPTFSRVTSVPIKDGEATLFAGLLTGVTALLIQNFFSVDMRFVISSTYLFFTMGLLFSFISKPTHVSWPIGWKSYSLKLIWLGFFIFLSGIFGLGQNPKGFFVLGIYQFSKNEQGVWNWKKTPAAGPGLIPALLNPYLSQKVVAKTPDFFDEKLLNSAQTIHDLEELTRQYPQQWRYWEKLGYALAKEILKELPDHRRVNDLTVAGKAISAYLKVYELNPLAEGAPTNLGNIYYTLNRHLEAVNWWKRAIEAAPDKIDARLNLGLAYYYEGKIKEASSQFEEVLKREPKNEKAIIMLRRMVE